MARRARIGAIDPETDDTNPPHDEATEVWHLYEDLRDRFVDLVRPLGPDDAGRTVPLTPGWTVAQVLAHVCGLNADVAAGMREGLGTDERTAHQVTTRVGHTVAQVCDEWIGHAEAMRGAIADDPFFGRRLSADLVVHLHDVCHALGRPIDPDDEATASGGRTYAARTPDRLVETAGVGMVIVLTDGSRFEPLDHAADSVIHAPSLMLRATPYDFLRSVTGRRSRREVAALDWSGDPTVVLDHFCPYGPLPDVDAGV